MKRIEGVEGGESAAGEPVDGQLEAVRERIEHWRRTRKKRTAMAEELWTAAVVLTEERGLYPVARRLKLNYDALKARGLAAELERRAGPSAAPGFVELPAAQVFGAPPRPSSEVELESTDGSRMTIRMRAGEALDVGQLSAAFWERRR
jgi:hypothetical protein